MRPLRDRLSRRLLAGLLLAGIVVLSSCTIRYSQSMVGTLNRVSPRPVSNSDSGTAVGIHPTLSVITFSEPTSAEELMTLPCEVAMSEVDYRGLFYSFYITIAFPEVKNVAYCVESTGKGG